MDVHGPVPVQSHSGYKYWVIFLDDNTKFKVGIPMRKKSDTFSSFLVFKAFADQLDEQIKAIQEDKGEEFMSKEFITYCENNGIARRHTVRKRPQQNGSAERGNRTGGERITCMLSEANLPMQFWYEALAALIHIWNCCPTSALKGKTPHELWFKRKPDVSHLRVWGCLAYVHIQKDK
jgi:transposase InsO family protein